MIRALQLSRPGWSVHLLTFVLGDRGFFDEVLWQQHWKTLGLSASLFKSLAALAVQVAHEVADEVLTAYNGALAELSN